MPPDHARKHGKAANLAFHQQTHDSISVAGIPQSYCVGIKDGINPKR
jgi:hypothetical protein